MASLESRVPPLPLLVTGLAGVAGFNAFQHLRERFGDQVLAIRRTDYWPLSGPGIIPCDMDDREAMRRLFDKHQFAGVLHCEGTCKLKSCELDPVMARRINVESMQVLLETIAGTDVRLVHLSIDLVFSGTRGGNHGEEDFVDPVTIYGKTMVEAEELIARERPTACMLRISLPMGVSFNGHAGAIDWIQSRFKKQKPATLYFDERRTPTYTDCLSPLLLDVLSRPEMRGLYHAGGPRSLSLYEIAQVVNRVGGYRPEDLMGCLRIEAGPLPPRAGDVSMNCDKLARALGYEPFDPWPYHAQFVPTHADWHRDRNGELGSPELLAEVLYRNPGRTKFRVSSFEFRV
jgi:dTDP-4-dehydrorhamnose reductase